MKRKIIGVTVGSPLPKPNLMQTDPTKGDYVKGKEEFLQQIPGGGGSVTDEQIEKAVNKYLDENPVDDGVSGVWVGSEAPTDSGYNVWVDPNGRSTSEFPGSGSNADLDTTLTQSGKAADAKATGDAVNAKVDKNGVSQITPENTTFIVCPTATTAATTAVQSVNVFDKASAVRGFYSTSNQLQAATTGAYTTDAIPVSPGDIIRTNQNTLDDTTANSGTLGWYKMVFLDADKNFIKAGTASNTTEKVTVTIDGADVLVKAWTVPENGAYVHINVADEYLDTFMVTINNPMPTTYTPYGEIETEPDEPDGPSESTSYGYKLAKGIAAQTTFKPLPPGFLKIAYSAFWSWAPINTVETYKTACFFGFDLIKGDIRITSDGVLVMCHDPGFTLDTNGRITTYDSGNYTPIREMTAAEVLALEHSTCNTQLGYHAHPCTVDDYLEVVCRYNKIPFVTVRDEYIDEIAPILLEKLEWYGLLDHAVINSYNIPTLRAFRALHPTVWLHNVNEQITEKMLNAASELYPCAVGLNNIATADTTETLRAKYAENADMIERFRAADIPVFASGIYSRAQFDYARAYGFKGGQMAQVSAEYREKRVYLMCAKRTNGEWAFVRRWSMEQAGTVTETDGKLYFNCADVIPSWLYYLGGDATARCISDANVSVTVAVSNGKVIVTPSAISDGMQVEVTLTI